MDTYVKLIHKTPVSYLPTAFPAHYYGLPNGKIYVVYSRFYDGDFGESGLEFIFAEHKEFFYDYHHEKIFSTSAVGNNPAFAETLDKPNPLLNIIHIKRDLKSYGEALLYLNREAMKIEVSNFTVLNKNIQIEKN